MKTFVLNITRHAYEDLDAIASSIARDSPKNSDLFLDRAFASFDDVLLYPASLGLSFPEVMGCRDVRRGLIQRQPNHLFYFVIDDDRVVNFRVVDGRRDDLAWLARRPRT